jgi:site-specific DNA-adenine methylase
MGSQEKKLPMLLTLLAKESKNSVNTFLETCVGSGQFLMQAPYEHFVVADLDPNITNFFKAVKNDPHNLEILGRLLKAYLKKRRNIQVDEWKGNWNDIWNQTLNKVNAQSKEPTVEASAASESLDKAIAFMLYRNSKSTTARQQDDENYREPLEPLKESSKPHKGVYVKDDMTVLISQLDKLPETQIVTQDLMKTLGNVSSDTDVIYIDPPYVKFTYDSQQAGTSVGGYVGKLTNDQQIESIQKLGEIIKQKTHDESGNKPMTIGYCNYATLDLVEEFIANGASKIHLFPLNARGKHHIEMLAIFKRPTQTNAKGAQTSVGEKMQQRKNLFHQMEEGEKAGSEPEIEVMKARKLLWVELGYLKKELVGLYKSEICRYGDPHLASVHKEIKVLNQQRHSLMHLVPTMRGEHEEDEDILEAVHGHRDNWYNQLIDIAQVLAPYYPQLEAEGKNPNLYFTPRWKNRQRRPSSSNLPELLQGFSSLNISKDKPKTKSTLAQDKRGLFINETVGDGNCFFRAVFEGLNNRLSTVGDQESLRNAVITTLVNEGEVTNHLFGPLPQDNEPHQEQLLQTRQQDISDVILTLTSGQWTNANTTVPYAAEALGITINVEDESGARLYTINPSVNPTGREIYITFTGNHFNSHTQHPL